MVSTNMYLDVSTVKASLDEAITGTMQSKRCYIAYLVHSIFLT